MTKRAAQFPCSFGECAGMIKPSRKQEGLPDEEKKLVATLLCGAMAAGSITVYAETVHAEGDTTITVMASQDWVYDAEMELSGKKFEEETGIKIDYQIVPADQVCEYADDKTEQW